jgi:hypothetical protein
MNTDEFEGHTPAPWIVTRAQKNTILIASEVLGCSDCGSTEIYTHANTGGKEIQFPKSVEPSPFTIDEGKNQWGDYDMYCPTCDLMDYTKPVDATQNEIDLELIAAAPDLLVDNKRLQEEVEHHKNMYCVDCGACGDMDSYADKHCICLFKTEGDDE